MTGATTSNGGSRTTAGARTRLSRPTPGTPILEVDRIGKSYGSIEALKEVTATIRAGEVTCVLGDNGAGKSTFIKILSGAHPHTHGELRVDGKPTRFASPRQALDAGIATVYQDLAVVPLMPVWRNFFLGAEVTKGFGPLRRLDVGFMRRTTKTELARMGINLRDVDQPIGTLSGGERQSVAIARAVYFGARVLILDEPTAALGVKQSGTVLKYIAAARDEGLAVVFITHNPHHAYLVGDRFVLLKRGTMVANRSRQEMSLAELTREMAGGAELEALSHELAERGIVEEDVAAETLEASAAGAGPAAQPTTTSQQGVET